jgi:hypothetical protein
MLRTHAFRDTVGKKRFSFYCCYSIQKINLLSNNAFYSKEKKEKKKKEGKTVDSPVKTAMRGRKTENPNPN